MERIAACAGAVIGALLLASTAAAVDVRLQVTDAAGQPLPLVMVTVKRLDGEIADQSDGGYPAPGRTHRARAEDTRFTDAQGRVVFDLEDRQRIGVRARKSGWKDGTGEFIAGTRAAVTIALAAETDPFALAAAKPANAWLAGLDLGDPVLKKHFMLQCNFCHQQGSAMLRRERSEEEWRETIQRMIGYGARPHEIAQDELPAKLVAGYARLRDNPALVGNPAPWQPMLARAQVREWPLGDSFSQMHDLLVHSNGLVYVGDNLQDRMYEVDPRTGEYRVYKLPRDPGDKLGGLLSARLKSFPRHETYLGIHSFAESAVDGHIFLTPSTQQRLVEFDPKSRQFTVHRMTEGYYPHTIRIDARDRVWFTLALSNQVAMFDRRTGKFHYIDLPDRNWREALTTGGAGVILKLMEWGVPLQYLPIDAQSTGVPLPYGIDVAPDGSVWFARLYSDAIGRIDPDTLQVTLIRTPFMGPRRLRADRDGNLWIAAFPESAIYCYQPRAHRFVRYVLPTQPAGSDTPYSLNVDRARHEVWVNGTESDTLMRLDIAKNRWQVYPMARRVTFTRDVEIAPDGSVYTANGAFPSWQIEDGQPTLIRVTPSPW